jgi:bacteriocin-like protein
MENLDLDAKKREVLTDEELKEITGGATNFNNFCVQFETEEECNKRKLLCQWGQFTCHVHPAAYGIFK